MRGAARPRSAKDSNDSAGSVTRWAAAGVRPTTTLQAVTRKENSRAATRKRRSWASCRRSARAQRPFCANRPVAAERRFARRRRSLIGGRERGGAHGHTTTLVFRSSSLSLLVLARPARPPSRLTAPLTDGRSWESAPAATGRSDPRAGGLLGSPPRFKEPPPASAKRAALPPVAAVAFVHPARFAAQQQRWRCASCAAGQPRGCKNIASTTAAMLSTGAAAASVDVANVDRQLLSTNRLRLFHAPQSIWLELASSNK